jgi:hypothetical protein
MLMPDPVSRTCVTLRVPPPIVGNVALKQGSERSEGSVDSTLSSELPPLAPRDETMKEMGSSRSVEGGAEERAEEGEASGAVTG